MHPKQKTKIYHAYRARFGGQPFRFFHMGEPESTEALRLMARALMRDEPVLSEDKDRLNAPKPRDGSVWY